MPISRTTTNQRSSVSVFVATALFLAAGPTNATKNSEDTKIVSAFSNGSMDLEDGELKVERLGKTTLLHVSRTDENSPITQTLVCALCTPSELVEAAWTAGRGLAASAGLELDTAEYASSVSSKPNLPTRDKTQKRKRIAISMGGFGLALAAAGAVLLGFNGECASSQTDENGNCRTLHDTGAVGWSFLGGGLTLATVGLIVGILSERVDNHIDWEGDVK